MLCTLFSPPNVLPRSTAASGSIPTWTLEREAVFLTLLLNTTGLPVNDTERDINLAV